MENPIRVLYLLWNYAQISETYIATEIAFAQKCGVEVHVWSQINYHRDLTPQCMVHRGSLAEAIAAVGPDVENKEAIFFSDVIDFQHKLIKLLADPEKALAIGREGRKACLERHMSTHRAKTVLDKLA